jgi:hypothetical protein
MSPSPSIEERAAVAARLHVCVRCRECVDFFATPAFVVAKGACPRDAWAEPRRLASDPVWDAFHALAQRDAITPEWLADFSARIDILNVCGCGKNWARILDAHPLPAREQFAWSVARRNDVRALRAHPPLSEQEIAAAV